MASSKAKYYVVWEGTEPGIYTSWEACKEAVEGFGGAKYKAFKSEAEAEEAFEMGYEAHTKSTTPAEAPAVKVTTTGGQPQSAQPVQQQNTVRPPVLPPEAINDAIAVDAACSGNPGMMEYRGVYLKTGKQIFHYGPIWGTNNIGEFLAIVHGLALLKQKGLHNMPIYSDSRNAQLWIKKRQCKTTLERNDKSAQVYDMIRRAEQWLKTNTYSNTIIKWPTDQWGEIPADFGRK